MHSRVLAPFFPRLEKKLVYNVSNGKYSTITSDHQSKCRVPLLNIVFSADDDAWNRILPDKVSDLVVYNLYHLKGFAGGDRIDEDVTVDANRIFRIQNGKFILLQR
jgi:hypothetical protein